MVCYILYSCFIILVCQVYLYCGASIECKEKNDVVIIFEEPVNDFDVTGFHEYFGELARNINDCYKLSIQIVDGSLMYPLLMFDENNFKLQTIKEKINLYEKSHQPITKQNSTKRMLVKEFMKIERGLFRDARKDENIGRKMIVILSRSREKDSYLENVFGELVESGYDIYAIGVADGVNEKLIRMTFDIAKTKRYSTMNALFRANIFTSTFTLRKKEFVGGLGVIEAASLGVGIPGIEDLELEYVGTSAEKCEYAVDIAFLIDSSKSVQYDYQKLLHFVREIARTFGISDTGTHAGAVLFSDYKNYTKVYIKLNEYDTTESFNQRIFDSPFIGHRTRIDLAFQLTERELFTFRGGARPNMRQVIFLITDGRQNPRSYKSAIYDPVEASRQMYERGINIFAVGVGQIINRTELEAITRHKDRVFYEANFDAILEENFIRSVSKKLCKGAIAGTTPSPLTMSIPTNKTVMSNDTQSSNCSKDMHNRCCSMRDVYVNIFNGGSGPKYVIQGVTVTHNKGSLISTFSPNSDVTPSIDISKKISTQELIETLKKNLPFDKHLIDIIERKLKGDENMIVKRKRRSSERNSEISTILDAASKLGCSEFVNRLQKIPFVKQLRQGIIFCPLDQYISEETTNLMKSKIFFKNQIARKVGSSKLVYETLSHNKLLLVQKKEREWTVNDVPVLFKLNDQNGFEIFIMKGIFPYHDTTIELELMQRPQLSLFRYLWMKSHINLFNMTTSVDNLCFANKLCLNVANDLKSYLHDTLNAFQFSIIAPTNKRLTNQVNINKSKLTPTEARDVLKAFVYIGKIKPSVITPNQISYSLSSEANSAHFYLSSHGQVTIVDRDENYYTVKEEIETSNAILYVVE